MQNSYKLKQQRIACSNLSPSIGGDKDMIERIYREGYLNISDLETLTVVLARELWKRILR